MQHPGMYPESINSVIYGLFCTLWRRLMMNFTVLCVINKSGLQQLSHQTRLFLNTHYNYCRSWGVKTRIYHTAHSFDIFHRTECTSLNELCAHKCERLPKVLLTKKQQEDKVSSMFCCTCASTDPENKQKALSLLCPHICFR